MRREAGAPVAEDGLATQAVASEWKHEANEAASSGTSNDWILTDCVSLAAIEASHTRDETEMNDRSETGGGEGLPEVSIHCAQGSCPFSLDLLKTEAATVHRTEDGVVLKCEEDATENISCDIKQEDSKSELILDGDMGKESINTKVKAFISVKEETSEVEVSPPIKKQRLTVDFIDEDKATILKSKELCGFGSEYAEEEEESKDFLPMHSVPAQQSLVANGELHVSDENSEQLNKLNNCKSYQESDSTGNLSPSADFIEEVRSASFIREQQGVHAEETPNISTADGKIFSNSEWLSCSSELGQHRQIHKGEKTNCCTKYRRRLIRGSGLRWHRSVHLSVKPHQCNQCVKTFKWNCKHRWRCSNCSGGRPYQCRECERTVSRAELLKMHQITPTGGTLYKCTKCGKSYRRRACLKLHLRRHTGQKPYKCTACGKNFRQTRHLKVFGVNSNSDLGSELMNQSSDIDMDSDSESDSCSVDSDPPSFSDARVWCRLDATVDHPAPSRFPFTGNPGLKVSVGHDYLDYLRLFIDDRLMEQIVNETNRYADQCQKSHGKPFARPNRWYPVTADDMWVFFGLLILQGILGKPVQRWYWSTNRLLQTPIFSEVMSECRFSLIMKYLHFTNNEDYDEANHPAPRLFKLWEIYQAIVKNMQKVYVPERDVSIHESLMDFKGRLSWIQYISSKRARFGIKFYMLCEASSGYIWNSILHTGKGTRWEDKYSQYNVATSSVLSLADPLLDQGYCITMDSFCTSPALLEILIQRKTDAYGSVRPNRRDMPGDFSLVELQRGTVAAWQKGKMIAIKWNDRKDICLLSTVHNGDTVHVRVRGNEGVAKPCAVVAYNNTMGGFDRVDRALMFYPVMYKRQKKYYKKIFRHLLEQCLWNAFVLYKKTTDKALSHADFTWKVVESILKKHQPSTSSGMVGRRRTTCVNPERLIGRHFIDHCPPTAKKKNPTRMCVICCSKRDETGKKVRKETRFYCPDCNVGLCVGKCFKTYHTKDVY
ncbi:piggyBac transposable element-derived protein 4-like isoform X2 [Polypterus senegalus]|uniref:piggyBac transposable element-derived protein 4-like isoform X2 n=1 Tax=Polypterus senegalus TaxID=55291 RepID=UPI0019632361|nr:piggyBac transposable element-derived protein 4-like isoform X2 [Polypterus senegalus]